MSDNTKYLYGAAVQGIQGFIFQTNELQDIVGASELVEQICTTLFKEVVGKDYKNENSIISAAGNIKYEFENGDLCKKAVRDFPRKVMEFAPGITVSQAVIAIKDNMDWKQNVENLEQKLRSQRNRQQRSATLGLMGIRRSRQTGLPVTTQSKDAQSASLMLDAQTASKKKASKNTALTLAKKAFGDDTRWNDIETKIDQLVGKNNWIAVVHADGNGVGKIVEEVGKDRSNFNKFSNSLTKSTKEAAQLAYNDVKHVWEKERNIPIRPIVLAGDDFTFVCRGDIAVDFVKAFMIHFEMATERMCKDLGISDKIKKLTACAGIAYVNKNFPFYYAYDLAEKLCENAKIDCRDREEKDSKVGKPSCLMFHKVQDSYVSDYKDIMTRELTPCAGWSFKNGPYYLNEQDDRMTISEIQNLAEKLSEDKGGNAIKSNVRRWMSLLSEQGEQAAIQMEKRLLAIAEDNDKRTKTNSLELGKKLMSTSERTEDDNKTKVTPAYDVLALCSLINKTTND